MIDDLTKVPERVLDSLRPSRRDNEHIVHRSYLKVVNSSNLPYVKASDEHKKAVLKAEAIKKKRKEEDPFDHIIAIRINPNFKPENVELLHDKVTQMIKEQELTNLLNDTVSQETEEKSKEKKLKINSERQTMAGMFLTEIEEVENQQNEPPKNSEKQPKLQGPKKRARSLNLSHDGSKKREEVNIDDLDIRNMKELAEFIPFLESNGRKRANMGMLKTSAQAVRRAKYGATLSQLYDKGNESFLERGDRKKASAIFKESQSPSILTPIESTKRRNFSEEPKGRSPRNPFEVSTAIGSEANSMVLGSSIQRGQVDFGGTEKTEEYRSSFFQKVLLRMRPKEKWEKDKEVLEEPSKRHQNKAKLISLDLTKPVQNYVKLETVNQLKEKMQKEVDLRVRIRKARENPKARINSQIKEMVQEMITFNGQKSTVSTKLNISKRQDRRHATRKLLRIGSNNMSDDTASLKSSSKVSIESPREANKREKPKFARQKSNFYKEQTMKSIDNQLPSIAQTKTGFVSMRSSNDKKNDLAKFEYNEQLETQLFNHCIAIYRQKQTKRADYNHLMEVLRENRPQTMKIRIQEYSVDKISKLEYDVNRLRRDAEVRRKKKYKIVLEDSKIYERLMSLLEQIDSEELKEMEYIFDVMDYLRVIYEEGNCLQEVDVRNIGEFSDVCCTKKQKVSGHELRFFRILLEHAELNESFMEKFPIIHKEMMKEEEVVSFKEG